MPVLLCVFSVALLGIVVASTTYLYLLAIGSIRMRPISSLVEPRYRFAIAIPAHDEDVVIGHTISTLQQLDYPKPLYDVFVVADFCADNTARIAREHGAIVYERSDGMRGSKGAALAWLFERILATREYDAIVVFDADTQADSASLRVMNGRLAGGDLIVQGCHFISNPQDSSFSSLRWAMYIIDRRFQNLGRSNLGFSCWLMGDSFCVRTDLLERLGWDSLSLTEDYEFRFKLLLEGICIAYEPTAIGYGEAPVSWAGGRTQRARWLKGTSDVSRRYIWRLLREGLRRRDAALLDGAAQTILPSYSTTVLISVFSLVIHALLPTLFSTPLVYLWAGVVILLAIYPVLGLTLERAPWKAYRAILFGPWFILWRTWAALVARFGRKSVIWVRTSRRDMQ